jgi:hypothetical protein
MMSIKIIIIIFSQYFYFNFYDCLLRRFDKNIDELIIYKFHFNLKITEKM